MKFLLTFSLASLFVFSTHMNKAQAHGGEGAIILLPFTLTFTLIDYGWLSAKAIPQGFRVNLMDVSSENQIELSHKKLNLNYSFHSSSSSEDAKSICAGLVEGRLASPEEVLKLYSLRSIDRVSTFIMTDVEPGYVLGFYDGKDDYFKMNVKSKKITTYNRGKAKEKSPVVCVEDLKKVRADRDPRTEEEKRQDKEELKEEFKDIFTF